MNTCTERRRASAIGLMALCLLATACAPGPARKPEARSTAMPSARSPAQVPVEAAAESRFAEALAMMKARQFDAAREAFASLARDFPQLSGPHTDLGLLLAQQGETAAALASLDRAVAANPANALAHNGRGVLLRQLGRHAEAEQAYQRALQVRPAYADAQLNLAILYDVALNRPQQALDAYRAFQSLQDEPDLLVSAWIHAIESAMAGTEPTRLAELSR